MYGIEEADTEVFGFDPAVTVDLNDLAGFGKVVFFQFLFDQRFRKPRGVDLFQMNGTQKKRNAADMVFMSVGNDQRLDLGLVAGKIGIVGNNIVDAQKFIFREQDTAVDDDDLILAVENTPTAYRTRSQLENLNNHIYTV